MIKIITYTCTIIPTIMWFMLMDSNLNENILVNLTIGMSIISIIGLITSAIMLKKKYKTTTLICLLYNLMIAYALVGGLLYTGAIKI